MSNNVNYSDLNSASNCSNKSFANNEICPLTNCHQVIEVKVTLLLSVTYGLSKFYSGTPGLLNIGLGLGFTRVAS